MKRTARVITAFVFLLALGSCSESTTPAAAKAASFPEAVCPAISKWGSDIVDAANAFTALSPSLSLNGRKAQSLFAFDKQEKLTRELRAEIEAASSTGVPNADQVRGALLRATDDVVQNIRDNKADSEVNVDFHTYGPRPDRLFAGTEKNLSLMLKPLDELARDQHIDALGGHCGR
ncbi:MAG TPA: hypothetical protein VFV00_19355 [Acidimicrobiales bacterium]|nr:hypothetical protein [Acidimicrobiales bacterium]